MNHRRAIRSAMLALTTAILLCALPSVPNTAQATESSKTANKWQYELRALTRYFKDPKRATRSWHRKKRPSRSELIELDPPLPTSTPDKVEFEGFFTYIEELPDLESRMRSDGWTRGRLRGVQGWPSSLSEFAWRYWYFQKLPDEIKERVQLSASPVSTMPGGKPALNDYHVEYQKMVMGWQPNDWLRVNNPIHWKLRNQLARARSIPDFDEYTARNTTEHDLEAWGVPIEEWRQGAASEATAREIRRNNERLAEITRRSRALDQRYARPPRLLVILINGRYVIEASNIPKLTRRIQIANYLIDRELKAIDKRRAQRAE